MRWWQAAWLGVALAAPAIASPERMDSSTTEPALVALRARVAAAAEAGRARVGLAAIDVATGQMVSVNGGERFPMASTVKVAIAATFLHQVQTGRAALDGFYTGRGRRRGGGQTGAQLIDLMLIHSNNRAADILLDAVGGTPAVERWLGNAGVVGQRMDRSIAQLLSDRQVRERVRAGHGRHRHWVSIWVPRAARAGDQRDSSTPEAMAALLVKLRDGRLLDETRTSYLFEVMSRCRTGPNRIRGQLPPGTPVAHKTGTLDGVTDDVGIVNLPNGHQLAIAIFEKGAGGVAAHDRSIAHLSRLLFDGFAAVPARAAAANGREPGWWGVPVARGNPAGRR